MMHISLLSFLGIELSRDFGLCFSFVFESRAFSQSLGPTRFTAPSMLNFGRQGPFKAAIPTRIACKFFDETLTP